MGADASQASPGSPDQLTAQYDEKLMESAGNALYALVFHSNSPGPLEAEQAFRAFVTLEIQHEQQMTKPPSIFVRLLPQQSDTWFIVPMALARVRVSSSRSEYLGLHFRIQTPLELQDYRPNNSCISKWTLLVPPENLPGNPLSTARKEFSGWIKTFQMSPAYAQVFDDLATFKTKWLNPDIPPAEENDAVLILSHHQNNTLHFDPDDEGIFPNMTRRYASPSLVMLAACETANPGAFEFVREFNLKGASTILASAVDVPPQLAGDLLTKLADAFAKNSARMDYTVDQALFDAQVKVAGASDQYPTSPQPWGARVLMFELIGNGALHICIPHNSEPQLPGNSAGETQ